MRWVFTRVSRALVGCLRVLAAVVVLFVFIIKLDLGDTRLLKTDECLGAWVWGGRCLMVRIFRCPNGILCRWWGVHERHLRIRLVRCFMSVLLLIVFFRPPFLGSSENRLSLGNATFKHYLFLKRDHQRNNGV